MDTGVPAVQKSDGWCGLEWPKKDPRSGIWGGNETPKIAQETAVEVSLGVPFGQVDEFDEVGVLEVFGCLRMNFSQRC